MKTLTTRSNQHGILFHFEDTPNLGVFSPVDEEEE